MHTPTFLSTADPVFVEAFDRSVALSEFIGSNLGETTAELSRNEAVALAMFSITLEHREAILLLIGAGARTTANAVLRPAYEAYIRALWIKWIATDQDIDQFFADRSGPSLERMVQRLRKAEPGMSSLVQLNELLIGIFHDYTHGGPRQTSRWLGPDGIGPRHTDTEMVETLRTADMVGLFACIAREMLMGRPTEPFQNKLKELRIVATDSKHE